MKILLVEDDLMLGDAMLDALEGEPYQPTWVKDGKTAINHIKASNYNLVVLDIGLPVISGTQLLQKLRSERNDIPVLMLTARDSIQDKVKHLDLGADDYLVKPFDMSELKARMNALCRRKLGSDYARIEKHGICLDLNSESITYNREPIQLPKREYLIFKELFINAGKVFSKRMLEQLIESKHKVTGSNTIEVHIHNIRAKFQANIIKTIRGIGYIIEK